MYGNTSMQPIRPNGAGFQAINAPAPLDALSRVLQNGQDTFAQITPKVSPTPPTSTTPQTPTTPTTPTTGAAGSTDLSADPILTQIKAIGQRTAQDAYAGSLAGAKNDLINYGSVQVPQSLRDLYGAQVPTSDQILGDLPGNPVLAALNDAGTAQAATGNPFSTTAQLGHAHEANVHGLDQASNLANLYYSSTHANELGDENNAYLGSQNAALQALAQALSGENTGLLGAVGGAHDQYVNELPNAYQRSIAAGGSGATGGETTGPPGSDTTPSDTNPPGPAGFGGNFNGTPFNPLLAALAGMAPGAAASRLNRYAG